MNPEILTQSYLEKRPSYCPDKTNRIPLPPVELLKEKLHYNPETGIFTWKARTGNRVKIGSIAGRIPKVVTRINRYIRIQVCGRRCMAHRLAFLYMTGKEPPFELDHKDGNTFDNSWGNIRAVTQDENSKNRKLYVNNKSGIPGVNLEILTKDRWRSRIRVKGKLVGLGTHHDFFEACCVRKSSENKYGFHANHGKR